MPSIPTLVNDLGQLWGDIKDMARINYILWTDPQEAPPSIRNVDLAFIPLYDSNNNPVGTFVPELFELAKVNGLRCQVEEANWNRANPNATEEQRKAQSFYSQIYKADGTRKSAFRLSVLPVIYSDKDQKSARQIQKRAEAEFEFRKQQGQPLPAVIYKYQVNSDYLRKLNLLKLKTQETRSIKLNLLNPARETTGLERALHYLGQRMALIVTLALACTVAGVAVTWTAAALAFTGTVLAEWCLNEFGFYGTMEGILREVDWMRSRDFALSDRISIKKLLKTTLLLSTLTTGVGAAAFQAYQLIMGVALPALTVMGVALPVVGLQMAVAGLIATTGAIGAFLGGIVSQRFFWGLGIWDNQIDFYQEKMADFPVLHKETVTEKLERQKDKILGLLAEQNPGNTLAMENVKTQVTQAYTHLQQIVAAPQPQPAVQASTEVTSTVTQALTEVNSTVVQAPIEVPQNNTVPANNENHLVLRNRSVPRK